MEIKECKNKKPKMVKSKYTGIIYKVEDECYSSFTNKTYYLILNNCYGKVDYEWWEKDRFREI